MTLDDAAASQRPRPGDLVLDHVAHFIPDMAAAEAALERLGFAPTPVSHQMHRPDADGPPVPAGTANRTAMLARGYLEFLATTGDTPNAAKLRAAMARYTGVHLVCFGTADAARTQARLRDAGFDPPPAVALEREVAQADGGRAIARFAVMRPAPDRMPEGRIQVVEHLTPAAIWQRRYLTHPNGAPPPRRDREPRPRRPDGRRDIRRDAPGPALDRRPDRRGLRSGGDLRGAATGRHHPAAGERRTRGRRGAARARRAVRLRAARRRALTPRQAASRGARAGSPTRSSRIGR